MSTEPLDTKAPEAGDAETQQKHSWSTLAKDHVLYRFGSELKSILDEAAYDEMYGVKLVAANEG